MYINRAFTSRLKPTKKQEALFRSWAGVRKFAYNDAHWRKRDAYARAILSGEKPLKNIFNLRDIAKCLGINSSYEELDGEWVFSLTDPKDNSTIILKPSIHGTLDKHVRPDAALPWLQERADRLPPPPPKDQSALRNRKEFPFLLETPAVVYREACTDLDDAFKRFWKPPSGVKVGYPKRDSGLVKRFRMEPGAAKELGLVNENETDEEAIARLNGDYVEGSGKHHDGPLTVYRNVAIRARYDAIKFPGLDKEWVKLFRKGYIPTTNAKLSEVAVHERAGKWYISVIARVWIPDTKPSTDKILGVDKGHRKLMVDSDGKVYGKRRDLLKEQKIQQRITRLGRKMDRQVGPVKRAPDGQVIRGKDGKQVASKSWHQTKRALSRAHFKLANIRNDLRHQASHRLLDKDIAVIRLEDIDVQGMTAKNPTGGTAHEKRLRKINVSVGYYELDRQIEYKANWKGVKVEKDKRTYYTSAQCPIPLGGCGEIDTAMGSKEFHRCKNCGFGITHGTDIPVGSELPRHHRDFGAATTHADPEPGRAQRDSAWAKRSTLKGPAGSGLPGRKSKMGSGLPKGSQKSHSGRKTAAINNSESGAVDHIGGLDCRDTHHDSSVPATENATNKLAVNDINNLQAASIHEKGTARKPASNPLILKEFGETGRKH